MPSTALKQPAGQQPASPQPATLRRCLVAATMLAGLAGLTAAASAETITIATVNNNDMINMQKLSPKWEAATGNKVNWIVLEENVLRQRVTTDIATKGGQFDIVTIGSYETPIWGKQHWLAPVSDFPAAYDYNDIFPAIRDALSYDGKMYAVPFYAESSMTFYRTDLFQKAGLTMPDKPTWTQIREFADKLTDKSKQQYGVCLRGKPGWGENMALFDTMVNTFGGRWFNEKWQPQLDTPQWKAALTFYVDLAKADGPPGITSNGFNENEALYVTGHCAIWVDATSAAGAVFNPAQSQVSSTTGLAAAPVMTTPHGAAWFWAWALAIPATSKHMAAAKSFLQWSTDQAYIKLVGDTLGWTVAPPGTRASTYQNADYLKAAPFAKTVETAILSADPRHPTAQPVPYTGVQYVAIPEFQGIGTRVGQLVAGAVTGQTSIDETLKQAQAATARTMKQAGYPK